MENSIDLKNKNVLVTGGSQGIGAAICRAMASCGANIIINYLDNKQRAEILAADLQQAYGIKALAFQADVADQKAVIQLFEFMDNSLGKIDILVNNAGCETIGHAINLSLEEWDLIFNVNLKGAFICAQEAGKRMVKQNSGVIINISSIHDKVPRKGLVHYCASKAGMNMMTKCLALELAENNIRVVTVAPGAIETEMNKSEIEKFGREKFNKWIPSGRLGVVDDVAWTCAFLASDMAAYLTATEIYIDGAYKESTIPYDPRP
ncbi:glucose 1-dehydrogenase [Chitinophaga polysaccharea]|uniref:SDR family NAD(P)-dependent oxidoreductase n=1 Tax=Chitinophaga TaxID=79328 RepID=UPI0014553D05|nr:MULTISPECIES: glucose 1-dehydrogenase [Chitinophaga]NLR60655.1 glucose 1-dehydrogenase [Chitinophaga polysaccharea]NLU90640.1 glucose 1-dehydrogenase [Chitinophaga sp. Ak27]